MKMHKIEVYVLDFDGYGIEEATLSIENCRGAQYPKTFAVSTADVGEWEDRHELNKSTCPIETFRKYFKKEQL